MAVPVGDWLGLMEREYLAGFIPAGGAAVRFVVAEPPVLEVASAGLQAQATRGGLVTVTLDTATVRLHMLQNVVFAIAASLPLDGLLQARLEALVAAAGYTWPDPGRRISLAALAEANGVAPHLLRRDMAVALTQDVWRDTTLTLDMRNAIIALLDARLTGDGSGVADAVLGWLQGTIRSLAALKPAQIGRRIGRQNARATMMSLCHWVRRCGGPGILLVLDIRQLHRERRDAAEGLFYTPAAVMDCYEVLRQLIDDAEAFPGLFVAVLAGDAFLSDDPKRSLGQYTALQMRIADDVRPQGGDNPLAPMVRLAA